MDVFRFVGLDPGIVFVIFFRVRDRFLFSLDVGVTTFAVPEFEECFGGVTAAAIPLPPELIQIIGADGQDLAVQVVELVTSETGGWVLEVQIVVQISGVTEFCFTFSVPIQEVDSGRGN